MAMWSVQHTFMATERPPPPKLPIFRALQSQIFLVTSEFARQIDPDVTSLYTTVDFAHGNKPTS